jgi:hypothetical protein
MFPFVKHLRAFIFQGVLAVFGLFWTPCFPMFPEIQAGAGRALGARSSSRSFCSWVRAIFPAGS